MKTFFNYFNRIFAITVIVASLLHLFDIEAWYVRIFDYPRLQIFILSLLSLALFYFFDYRHRKKGKLLMAALLITIGYQFVKIIPYTGFANTMVKYSDKEQADDATVTLMVANVLMSNSNYNPLIELIEKMDPDILLTLESDHKWGNALDKKLQEYPNRVKVPKDNTYGMHLYSKLPLRNEEVKYWLDKDIPSISCQVQLQSGAWIDLYGVHPKPPVPTEDANSRKRDAEIMIVANRISKKEHPVIVAGDFNDVAWSATTELFLKVSGTLDPRIGRGFYNTYHTGYFWMRWPLDHFFHSPHFKLIQLERLQDIGSDHFPIFITLSFEPENQYDQEKMEPDEDTQEKETETIEEGLEEARESANR
jgi:endonuclease/exonuclease/phosphatase (EEP) superfamily protein YafD